MYSDTANESYRASHLGPELAADYDRDFWQESSAKGLNWLLERRILDAALRRHRVPAGAAVLDFACGTGRVLGHLEGRFDRAYGVDVSEDMLATARRRCRRSAVISADVTTCPDAIDVRFGLITAFRFFLNAEADLRAEVLAWMAGALAPGGVVIANFHLNPRSLRGGYLRLRWRGRWQTPMLGVRDARRLFEAAGFEILDVVGYDYLPYRRDGARLLAPGLRARVEQFLVDRRAPAAVAGSFVLVARRAAR